MIGNANDLMNIYQQIKTNPAQFFNLPRNVNPNDPNSVMQYLMNNNMISQKQINWAMGQMKNNPIIRQMFGGR